jgi:hypothetical protein
MGIICIRLIKAVSLPIGAAMAALAVIMGCSIAIADALSVDPSNLWLDVECTIRRTKCEEPIRSSPVLDLRLSSCEAVVNSNQCRALVKKNPELSVHIKRCSPDDLCDEHLARSIFVAKGCALGYGEGTVDLVNGLKDLFVSGFNHIKANQKIIDDFIKVCSPSLSCRREVAQINPSLRDLSDIELQNYDMRALLRMSDQNLPFKKYKEAHPETKSDKSLWDHSRALYVASEDWLRQKKVELSCFDLETRSELMCYGLSQILDPTVAAGLVAKSAKLRNILLALDREAAVTKDYSFVRDRRVGSTVSHNISAKREQIKAKLLNSEYTTEAENLNWIAKAERPRAKDQLFIEIENAKLKQLNDTLKDKDLVTSMTNMHKQLSIEEFTELAKKYPGLKFYPYSDFKSLRFAIEGEIPATFQSDIAVAFSRAQKKFDVWAKTNKLIRETDEPVTSWFKMGSGQLADEASAAARFARTQPESKSVVHFASSEVSQSLALGLQRTDGLRSEIVERLANSNLVEKSRQGPSLLKTDVFEVLRKSSNATEAAEKLKKRFGLAEINPELAGKMFEYSRSVDSFSPSLYIGKREVATLEAADKGGFSVDFVGLGAQNISGTAAALAGAQDVSAALERARQAEKKVTSIFTERRNSVKEISEGTLGSKLKTVCSGDDCVGVPAVPLSLPEKQRLLNSLASQTDGANLRVAFIQPGIKNREARSVIAVHGEQIEKYLRESLEGQIEPQRLKGVLFAVDMKATNIGVGRASLIMGQSPSLSLSAIEKSKIDDAFKSAVESLNKNFTNQSGYLPE